MIWFVETSWFRGAVVERPCAPASLSTGRVSPTSEPDKEDRDDGHNRRIEFELGARVPPARVPRRAITTIKPTTTLPDTITPTTRKTTSCRRGLDTVGVFPMVTPIIMVGPITAPTYRSGLIARRIIISRASLPPRLIRCLYRPTTIATTLGASGTFLTPGEAESTPWVDRQKFQRRCHLLRSRR